MAAREGNAAAPAEAVVNEPLYVVCALLAGAVTRNESAGFDTECERCHRAIWVSDATMAASAVYGKGRPVVFLCDGCAFAQAQGEEVKIMPPTPAQILEMLRYFRRRGGR